jgi:anti-sigma factor RsiW
VICADWHPDDERLLTRYLDGADADASLDAHLAWCPSCTRRLGALTRDLDGLHRAADGAAAEAFDDARLGAQRRAIQQRLGAAVPARVLAFPSPPAPGRHAPLIRVAAAVLLLALTGAGVVRILQLPPPAMSSAATLGSGAPASATTGVRQRDAAPEAVLEDIDLALLRPRTVELLALDEFTPHVRDIVAPVRRGR